MLLKTKKLLSIVMFLLLISTCVMPAICAEDKSFITSQIAIIDNRVDDYNTIAEIMANKMPVYIINTNSNAINQITYITNKYKNLGCIHIFSKGESANINIGLNQLNNNTVEKYKNNLRAWGNSLNPNGNIMFYACNVANSNDGQELINKISKITGRNIAASTNFTGSYGTNTDWDLEYSSGPINTNGINREDMSKYRAKLDGTTRYWDGEGSDNNWSTKENWSGDKVPDATDVAVFNSACTSNVNISDTRSVSSLQVKAGYTGTISGQILTVENNFTMEDGTISLSKLSVKGVTNITGGELACSYIYTYDDISITGLTSPIDSYMHIYKSEKDTTTISGDFEVVNVTLDDANHNYNINGSMTINKVKGQYRSISFENKGILNINDGSVIDISNCDSYYYNNFSSVIKNYKNDGTIVENGTGKLRADSKDSYFCNSKGEPIATTSVGKTVYVSITDLNANKSKDTKDTVSITVKRESKSDDTAVITLTETENNSGIFRNLTGLELVDTSVEAGLNQLKYDGTENLIANYVDSDFAEDQSECKLIRDPIIWDGSESDEWSYYKNWNGDKVPKVYDVVLFNNDKDVEITSDLEISKIVVDNGYTGQIDFNTSSNRELIVYNDVVIKAGMFNTNFNTTINGSIIIEGGSYSVTKAYKNTIINGNLKITSGVFKSVGSDVELKGYLQVSGGSLITFDLAYPFSSSCLDIYGDIEISGGNISVNNLTEKNTSKTICINNISGQAIQDLVVEQSTSFNGNVAVKALTVNENKTLTISGSLICEETLKNDGTINISNDAVLDCREVLAYSNNLINDNSTGKVIYDAGGIGFVDEHGVLIDTVPSNSTIYVELVDLSSNKNSTEKETVLVTVTSSTTGDSETTTLLETGNDTSIFRSQTVLVLSNEDIVTGDNKLKYDGSEDLQAVYTDARDINDTISCNLYKTPIVWDGGGEDSNWTTPENWSTDKVPTKYDSVKVNDTSTKDIIISTNVDIYKLTIEDTYTGQITAESNIELNITSHFSMASGTADIKGELELGGNLTVEGGKLKLTYYNSLKHNVINGDLLVLGGEVLANGYLDVNGNTSITGGSFKPITSFSSISLNTYSDVDFLAETEITEFTMYGSNLNCSTEVENKFKYFNICTDGNVLITGGIDVNNFSNSNLSTVNVSGEGTVVNLTGGNFNNSKQLNIKDGAILNANFDYYNNMSRFVNRGLITESNNGRFLSDTKDMFFCSSTGEEIISAEVNDEIYVRLVDGNLNMNGQVIEEVVITIQSVKTNDTEDITLVETYKDSGVFINTTALTLIADNQEPNVNELKYNGTEDLQTIYTDSTDPNDVFICNLFRDPLIWDGGGINNYWFTAENWSEDRVPDEYDRVVFNSTSCENCVMTGSNKVYSLTIDQSYQGVVSIQNKLNIEENLTVNGAELQINKNYGQIIAKGDLFLNGGIFNSNTNSEDTFNNAIITNGELKSFNIKINDNFNMTGGSINSEGYSGFKVGGDFNLTYAETLKIYNLYISGNNINISGDEFNIIMLNISTDGEVNLNGKINLAENISSMYVKSNSTVNLFGEIVFCKESTYGLNNYGVLNLNSNSVFDARKAGVFENNGTISVSDTAKLYYDAESMGVVDESLQPALDDFNFGEPIIVLLDDKSRGLNSSTADNVDVLLKNWTNGDEETYNLIETGSNTNRFVGQKFTTDISDISTNNNIFEGKDTDALQIIYTDKYSEVIEYVVSKNCAELEIDGINDLVVSGIDFSTSDISASSSYTITLQNRGDIPLVIKEVSLDNTNDFSFAEGLDTSDIPDDSSRDITVNFTPARCGEKTGNLTIKTSDNDENEITIPLKGVGVEKPISSGIEDITLLQGTENYSLDLFCIFNDNQDSDTELDYEILYDTNTSLISSAVVDKASGLLNLELNTSKYGDLDINIRVTDTSNAYLDESFTLTVSQCYTVSGLVKNENGDAIQGAEVTVTNISNEKNSYSCLTAADGAFSITFEKNMIPYGKEIKVVKDPYKTYTTTTYVSGNQNLGTITLLKENDSQKAQRLAEALTNECLGFQNSDSQSSVTLDLLLATTAGEGSTIQWSSSHQSIISNAGVVNRPAYGNGDEHVTITATVNVNGQTFQKEFTVTVLQKELDKAQKLAQQLTDACLGYNDEVGDNQYQVTSNLTLVNSAGEGSIIEWSSSNESFVTTAGTVTRPAHGDGNKQVTLTATVKVDGMSAQREFIITVIECSVSKAQRLANDLTIDCLGIQAGDTQFSVTTNLLLAGSAGEDSVIEWESDSNYVSNTGIVTRPPFNYGDAYVMMTAIVKVDGQSANKVFDISIKRLNGNKAQMLAEDLMPDCLGVQAGDEICSVTQDLSLATTAGEGITIVWESSNTKYVSNSGEVTRPAKGLTDINVIMTATISIDGLSAEKEFMITVKAIEENGFRMLFGNCPIEGDSVIINVARVGDMQGTTSVDYTTKDYLAEAGSDYTSKTGTLTFLSNETNKTITIDTNDDDLYEDYEFFTLVLSNPNNNLKLYNPELWIQIEDNDPFPSCDTLSLQNTFEHYQETADIIYLNVNRSNSTNKPVTVQYRTESSSAEPGIDYIETSGTLEFGTGEYDKNIQIQVINDDICEYDKSFFVVISNVTGGASLGISKSYVTLQNDDRIAAPIIQSAVPKDRGVCLTWSSVEDAIGYKIEIEEFGEMPRSIRVDNTQNSYDVTELDNGTTYRFMITTIGEFGESEFSNFISATPNNGSVEPKTVPGVPLNVVATAAGDSQAQISFNPPADNGGSEITEYIVTSDPDNIIVRGTGTTIDITGLTNWVSYTFTVKAENAIGQGESSVASNAVIPCINSGTIGIEQASYNINEDSTSLVVKITRTGGSDGIVEVDYITVDSTATAGSDYNQTSGTLSFTENSLASQIITIPIINDSDVEGQETFKLKISNPTSEATLGVSEATVNIIDDDVATISIQKSNYSVDEDDNNIDIIVSRERDTESTIAIDFNTINETAVAGSDYISSSGTITFLAGEIEKTITLSTIDDDTYEGNENFKLVLSNPTTDVNLDITETIIEIKDNDLATPTIQTISKGDKHVNISWISVDGASGYKVYVSTTPGSYGLPSATLDSPVNSYNVMELSNGTTYYIVIKAFNQSGISQYSNEVSTVPSKPKSNDNSTTNTGVDILVNGKAVTAATSKTKRVKGKTVTTVTIDSKKVEEKLQQNGNNSVVTLPVNKDSNTVVGQLNGQTVKNMEQKEAVLEIRTPNVNYILPASQINIDSVSSQIGSQVELEDIIVNVQVAEPEQNTVDIVEDTANDNKFLLVVKPVDFQISCTYGNKTVEVAKFNAYVERTIAIPEGIEPNQVTTGVVLNEDGSFTHVPTVITIINNRYYAKIYSLSNSVYCVIFSPKTYKDLDNHWAKNAIEDMASRLVISGNSNDEFEPDRYITRGEFTSDIVKGLGLMRNGAGKDRFSDVNKNSNYYDAVSIAYDYNLVAGYSKDRFASNQKITREQAMAIVARAMQITKLNVELDVKEENGLLKQFADYKRSSTWAKKSIATCIKAEVIFGRNGKVIDPKDNITKAEVAAIIQRLLKRSKLI